MNLLEDRRFVNVKTGQLWTGKQVAEWMREVTSLHAVASIPPAIIPITVGDQATFHVGAVPVCFKRVR